MAVTLSQLRTRVRREADITSSTHVSDEELNEYINTSAAELHGILCNVYDDHYLTSTQFTLSSQNTYTLPTDFYRLRGLDFSDGGSWIEVPKFNFNERNRHTSGALRSSRWDSFRTFRVMQGAIFVLPEDNYAGTYRLWYTLKFIELTSDSDQLDDLMGWHEYVVVDAAIKCKDKEESDCSILMARKSALADRVSREAQNRHDDGPDRVAEVRDVDDDDLVVY